MHLLHAFCKWRFNSLMTEESDIFTQILFEHLLCGSIRIAWLGFNKFIFIYYVLYDNFILNLSNKQI